MDAREAGCTFPSPHAAKPHRQRLLLCNEDDSRLCLQKKGKHNRKLTFNRNCDSIALFCLHKDAYMSGKRNMSEHWNERIIYQRYTLCILGHHRRHKSHTWTDFLSAPAKIYTRSYQGRRIHIRMCTTGIALRLDFSTKVLFFSCHSRDLIQCGLRYFTTFSARRTQLLLLLLRFIAGYCCQ